MSTNLAFQQQPSWYQTPTPVRLRFAKAKEDTFAEETIIEFQIGKDSKYIHVPSSYVDMENKTVGSYETGLIGDQILFTFPPYERGRDVLQVPQDLRDKLVFVP